MRHPLQCIHVGRRLHAFLVLLALTLWLRKKMTVREDTEAAPHGLMSFVFAGDVLRASTGRAAGVGAVAGGAAGCS